jgi:simple sugar transport system ATP-binding protein
MLYRDIEILFLDEPTAVLTPQQVESFFSTLRSMAAKGKSIVLITHKLEEVMAIANRATIMRQGRVVGTVSTAQTSIDELARLMVGQDVEGSPPRTASERGDAVIVAEKLRFPQWAHSDREAIDLSICAGEILGVAGVAGNGQLQLAETLAGLTPPQSGRVLVNGVDVTGSGPRAARRAGLAYVPQDRLGTGLARGLSIADNLRLTRPLPFLLNNRRSETEAVAAIAAFNIKARGAHQKSGALSGGNIQKVLLCRELGTDANALIIASPTQGLDVAATEFVHNLINQHRSKGVAILLISEDLDEICKLSDRIVVMYSGGFVLERPVSESKRTELGLAMAGAAPRQAC